MRVYYTHFNGSRPYKVRISKQKEEEMKLIQVYKYIEETDLYEDEPLFTAQSQEVFIGKSVKNAKTKYSGGYGKRFTGSSILFKNINNHNQYTFIGDEVYTFISYDRIIKFSSPVLNSDVAYPVALDASGNVYLLIENVVLPLYQNDTDNLNTKKINSGYFQYYKTKDLNKRVLVANRVPTKEDYENNVFEYYYISYNTNPSVKYENFFEEDQINDYKLYLVEKRNPRNENSIEFKELTKREYIELIEEHGIKYNYKAILNKMMIE